MIFDWNRQLVKYDKYLQLQVQAQNNLTPTTAMNDTTPKLLTRIRCIAIRSAGSQWDRRILFYSYYFHNITWLQVLGLECLTNRGGHCIMTKWYLKQVLSFDGLICHLVIISDWKTAVSNCSITSQNCRPQASPCCSLLLSQCWNFAQNQFPTLLQFHHHQKLCPLGLEPLAETPLPGRSSQTLALPENNTPKWTMLNDSI